jgi:tetratricopeptide (TPR) repeat protein
VTLTEEGNRAGAIETLRRVVGARPDHAAAHAALGAAYREQGNYAASRAELERAVALDPNDLRANYQLGLVYAKLGDKEAAKKMFERADVLRGQRRNEESVILKLVEPPPQN